ncbi:MAG: MATE family efflux transporter [Candidatus Eisenbacteria bacterium]|nr:MATE family efflux transporter [Candidatus Eisenbacteria bacterium]
MQRLAERMGIRHGREIFSLAAPTILTMFSHTLMWTVDSAFLGHVSSLALASAGLGGMLTWTVYTLFNGLSRVTSTFVSQAEGRRDLGAVGDYTWQGIYIALIAGALLTVGGYYSHIVLGWTGNAPDIQQNAYVYVRYRTLSATATQLLMCLTGFFNGRKDMKTPMYAGVGANVLNVILDAILIFGWEGIPVGGARLFASPAMGLKGAAIATSIAVFANAAVLLMVLFGRKIFRVRYKIHLPRVPALAKIADLVRVGFPASIGNFIDMLSFFLFTALIGRTGEAGLAASQITIQILSFSFMPLWGLTISATVLVGNEIGKGDLDRAERYGNEAYRIAVYYTFLLALLIVGLGRPIFGVFTSDPRVLALAGGLAALAALFQVFDGLRMIGLGILEGAGDTRFPMGLAFVTLLCVFVPLTYLAVEVMGGDVRHAWIVGIFSYLLMAGGTYLRFRAGTWRGMCIFSGEEAALGD